MRHDIFVRELQRIDYVRAKFRRTHVRSGTNQVGSRCHCMHGHSVLSLPFARVAFRRIALLRSFARVHFQSSSPIVRRSKDGFAWRRIHKLGGRARRSVLGGAAMMHNTSCKALLVPGVASVGSVSPT
ncbi:MAG TPA: hypothetical protein VNA21_13950 [Steroidobacteraceae bacterium]|nr:hypothetical protein [Steroidobacteraceae bacterium]